MVQVKYACKNCKVLLYHADVVERVSLFLADGTVMDLSFCKKCADDLALDDAMLDMLWEDCLRNWTLEGADDGYVLAQQRTNFVLAPIYSEVKTVEEFING